MHFTGTIWMASHVEQPGEDIRRGMDGMDGMDGTPPYMSLVLSRGPAVKPE